MATRAALMSGSTIELKSRAPLVVVNVGVFFFAGGAVTVAPPAAVPKVTGVLVRSRNWYHLKSPDQWPLAARFASPSATHSPAL